MIDIIFLLPIFFGVSFLYSNAGFGGGSSYIAILALAGLSLFAIPSIALTLNIIVASIALFNYARAKHLSIRFALPFLSSIPFAFIAGQYTLNELELSLIFSITLFAVSATLFVKASYKLESRKYVTNNKIIMVVSILVGILLGILAGLVGIGGGIWLSPLLIISGLAEPKRAAATSSLFIVSNSISGLSSHLLTKSIDLSLLFPLAVTVLIGGFLGSRMGALRLDGRKIQIVIAIIVATAASNILIKYLGYL
ncbi:MAG: sulfite exporter TauE/SafE family protein [Candidatus Nitrosothermus koennekii]|nr:MAG: sulfite exporter TauE/SafE family protein [Candidatus Nitrosothermus koennekii]